MDNVEDLLKENGIDVEITNIGSEGFYLPKLRTIFINQNLDELEQKKVLLHESRHALSHNELISLYSKTVFHSKMEDEANRFMIEVLLQDYMNLFALSVDQINYMKFMDYYGIGYDCEEYIKKLLVNYVTSSMYLNVI
ncbi:ImmA/IrrE family metallo-endopeptidase [Enterococcus durans]|uniref:ImmA/IrrE family metallo-endopeptidase n=1 Tax=Enterococcus durans TaxID=53345 RepID=UPI000FFE4DFA|nr:ImmA/IrrE family metallo-endopeptidase [Enterococcus durans]RXE79414.1 ImmA/IrrE family metallo-endopeptidase [Enterococcus durans]